MTDTALTDDDGFGLVEAVVSMLVLALLAIAFLPLFITGLKQSAANARIALATQLVSERMSLAQAATSCSELAARIVDGTEETPRGETIDIATTVDPCGTGHGTFGVTVVARLVEDGEPGAELASASTLVFFP